MLGSGTPHPRLFGMESAYGTLGAPGKPGALHKHHPVFVLPVYISAMSFAIAGPGALQSAATLDSGASNVYVSKSSGRRPEV